MVILIVNNSIQIMSRLQEMLVAKQNISAIYNAFSFGMAVRHFKEQKPDAVLLEMNLQEEISIRLLKVIKSQENKTRVIMTYILEDRHKLRLCSTLGADFFCDLYYQYENLPALIDSLSIEKEEALYKIFILAKNQ